MSFQPFSANNNNKAGDVSPTYPFTACLWLLSYYQIPECKNGLTCQFLRQNRCIFYHSVAEKPTGIDFSEHWQKVDYHRRQQHRASVNNYSGQSSCTKYTSQQSDNVHQSNVSTNSFKWCRYFKNLYSLRQQKTETSLATLK